MEPLQKVVDVPPEYIGHVVGEGGSTIRRLRSETGTAIVVMEGCKICVTADSRERLRDALTRIRDIINAGMNPDYEGVVGSRLRKEAEACAAKRAALYDEVTQLRGEGNTQEVSAKLEEAKRIADEMRLKNREAAEAIARHNNEEKGKGKDYFDMHGLRVEEAVGMLKSRVECLRKASVSGVAEMQIITGAGRHSGPEGAKVKKAVIDFLQSNSIEFAEISEAQLRAKIVDCSRPAEKMKTEKTMCIC